MPAFREAVADAAAGHMDIPVTTRPRLAPLDAQQVLDLRAGRRRRDRDTDATGRTPAALCAALDTYCRTHAVVRADEFRASVPAVTFLANLPRPNAYGAVFRHACRAGWLVYERHVQSATPGRRASWIRQYRSTTYVRGV